MLFDWFDAKEATQFGAKLADDLSADIAKAKQKPSKKDIVTGDRAIQKMFTQVDQFKQKNQLNFYKKSKLINEFRWSLQEKGYDEDFLQAVVKELVIRLN